MTQPSAARQRILDTAFRLFYARGLRAVGVDTIIAESGVAKGTGQLHEAAAAAGPAPRDQLVGLFDALSSSCRREGYRGCAFLNAAAESVPGSPVHERTVAHKQAVLGWVEALAAEAGAEQPGALARSLTLLLDGGLASGALDADPEAARVAQRSASALVDASLR